MNKTTATLLVLGIILLFVGAFMKLQHTKNHDWIMAGGAVLLVVAGINFIIYLVTKKNKVP